MHERSILSSFPLASPVPHAVFVPYSVRVVGPQSIGSSLGDILCMPIFSPRGVVSPSYTAFSLTRTVDPSAPFELFLGFLCTVEISNYSFYAVLTSAISLRGSVPVVGFFVSLCNFLGMTGTIVATALAVFVDVLFDLYDLIKEKLGTPGDLCKLTAICFSSRPTVPLLCCSGDGEGDFWLRDLVWRYLRIDNYTTWLLRA